MGFLNLVSKLGRRQPEKLTVDLRTFHCGFTRLGQPPDPRDFFTEQLMASDECAFPREGFEVGTKANHLDYLCVTIAKFSGTFLSDGRPLSLSEATSPADILAVFGEPYWTDTMDSEMILFYEFKSGHIELQFEFPDRKHLAIIAVMQEGVLSDAEQRRCYQVTKSWPPV